MFLCLFPLYNLFEKGSLIVMSSTSVSLISYKCFFPVLVNLKHEFCCLSTLEMEGKMHRPTFILMNKVVHCELVLNLLP